ncbi:MAG: HD domain-containing protein [Bacteroidia bacterium]|nr:HD domain-containing protein [Bacteroidia bacterium]MDW8346407.1 HD domain-containing protein [Bacteroidia bacterium]
MPEYRLFSDPIYGFVEIPSGIIAKVLETPVFQRLRRISQLGLSAFVYPGATHTRFHHALGATYLMTNALEVLRKKGVYISDTEFQSAVLAILLHDIGHGPFSHCLEGQLFRCHHEEMSLSLMQYLNQQFDNQLELAIRIFKNEYERPFFHDLVSSQLDMDRMDYLQRDSYYCGVSEGVIGAKRLIRTLNVHQDRIVVEQKGLYSVERFMTARKIMYWQVYLHKTTIVAQHILTGILMRIRELMEEGKKVVFASPYVQFFFENPISAQDLSNPEVLHYFIHLDDTDFWLMIKANLYHPDFVLSDLCQRFINRKLFAIKMTKQPFGQEFLLQKKQQHAQLAPFEKYYFAEGLLENEVYGKNEIYILTSEKTVVPFSQFSDAISPEHLYTKTQKYYYIYPKEAEAK